jgi:hypothetical protein
MKQLAVLTLSLFFLAPMSSVLAADSSTVALRGSTVSQCKRKKEKKQADGGKKKEKKEKKEKKAYGFEL